MANKIKSQEPKAPKIKKDYTKLTGMLELFVVSSVAFSSYVVIMGVQSMTPRLLLAPQILWAAIQLVKRFTK
jgi:hypothetical protein